MTVTIGRRELLAALGGAAAAWPLAARAQQPAVPVIGYLSPRSQTEDAQFATAFQSGLGDAGYVEGQNVLVERRWADNHFDRLPALATDLVRRPVVTIMAISPPAVSAAKAATKTIPIVFTVGADPVKLGFVASLNRPGGNLTGVNTYGGELGSKELGVLRELAPKAETIALLVNPKNPVSAFSTRDVQEAARAAGQSLKIFRASTDQEIEAAFASIANQAAALLIGNDVFFNGRVSLLAALAARYSLPTLYARREFAVAGGLVSYGPSLAASYREAAVYISRILKGAKPDELPVIQPTKFELVLNLKTAKALGVTIPTGVYAIADEVIE
jgi:putative ABC transport system substrate-binding protein